MSGKLAIEGGQPFRKEPISPKSWIGEEEAKAAYDVVKAGGVTIWGDHVKSFEEEFAKYHDVKHAIAVGTGTEALQVALAAYDIGPGDEVIVPPYTMVSTASCVVHQNAIPIFADIDERTYNIDPEDVRKKITDKTKAVIPVHIFGLPADMDSFMKIGVEFNLKIIEDAAQSHGAEYKGKKVGSIAEVGCFSFTGKNVNMGTGGIILTMNDELDKKMRLLRHHGLPYWFRTEVLGFSYYLTEVQAAIGLVQLRKLDDGNAKRTKISDYYIRSFKDIEGISTQYIGPEIKACAFHLFVIKIDENVLGVSGRQFAEALNAEGVSSGVVYETPLHLQPTFRDRMGYGKYQCPYTCQYYGKDIKYEEGLCPVVEKIGKQIIMLPMHPNLTMKDAEDVVGAVRKVAEAYSARVKR